MTTLFYFDGLSSKAYACKIDIRSEQVHIQLDESLKIISWVRADITNFELTGNSLTIKHGPFPQETLEINGSDAVDFFALLSKDNLRSKSKVYWFKNTKTIVFSSILAFIGLCFISYFYLIPWLGEKAVYLIPKEAEVQLGQSIAATVRSSEVVDEEATLAANAFLNELKASEDYKINVTVVKSSTVNAFALPGGQLFIYSGIVDKMQNYEEFSALLAHEITHVTHQHSLKSLGRTAASSIFISALFGDVSGVTSGILDQANQIKQLSYSRELEIQADTEGVKWMVKNHISPKGMLDLMEILNAQHDNTADFMKYLSTHPETNERIKTLKNTKEIKYTYKQNDELVRLFAKLKQSLE